MEKPNFLSEKYPDLPGSKPVERAVDKARQSGEKIHDNLERVDAYMDRLERVLGREGKFDKEKGFHLLEDKILNEFTININDPETLTKVAEGLYESEKRIAVEQGRGGDIQKIGSSREIIEKYKPLVLEKAEIQRKTLSSWLDYLQQNDAKQPMWFRYFVVRSLEKMGTFNKEKGEYAKRNQTTVAPFPELNSEALGWVHQKFTEGVGEVEDFDPQDQNAQRKKEALEKIVQKKDFAKLYAFALVETAGKLNKETIEGEWRKYDQSSDYAILERDLKSKGTGWCTATGSAKAHLAGGDFYVYYTKGANGTYTEPRVAIRMDGEQLGEVRGVNHRQELEPALVDIAQAKYQSLPGGEAYDKKARDMKEMTKLIKKQEKGEAFTKEELMFLYEIDSQIEYFGYDPDPRIKELRGQRNSKEDMLIVFDCLREQVAENVNEINESTRAYLGIWSMEIFQKIRNYPNIQHLWESFPDKKIFMQTLETNPAVNSSESVEKALQTKNMYLSDWGKDILYKTEFSQEKQDYELVRFTVSQLGFANGATTDEIYKKAEDLGLELCPAEVGPHLRLQYPGKEWMLIAMKQITDRNGYPAVFNLRTDGGQLALLGYDAKPDRRWDAAHKFVFRFRKLET
ncbi:MAG: hypothetical protein WC238_04235 [Parcubacteria group bacterium]|jgi:hypothetical protein